MILRKYNTATAAGTHIRIPIPKAGSADFATDSDWTPAAGDVKISKDGGAEANIGTLPTFSNGAWEFQLTGAELTAKTVHIKIVDSATKAVEDQFIVIETFGHASAMYPPNLQDSVRLGLTALPNAAADAAGGLPISDAGGLDLDTKLANTNEVTAARMGALTDLIDGGRLDLLLDGVKAKTDLIPAGGFPANFSVLDINSSGFITRVVLCSTVTTLTGHTPQTGDSYARIGANGAGLTALPWNAAWDAEVQSEAEDALAAYDPPTNAEMEARTLAAASYATAANQTIIAAGLVTIEGKVDTIDGIVDAILVDTGTDLPALLATIDAVVDAIKAKTDSLTFTSAGKVDASIQAAADLVAAVCNKIADHVRRRTQANVEASADGDALSLGSEYGAIQQIQEAAVSGATLTVRKTDGSTTLGTKTLATDADAEPVVGVS